MDTRRRHAHLTAALALTTLVATTAFAAPAQAGPATAPDLTQAVTTAMGSARSAEAHTLYEVPGTTALSIQVEPHRTSRDGTWVFGGAAFLIPSGSDSGPVTSLFFGHLTGGAWQISLEGTSAFARNAGEAPAELMGGGERATLASTAAPATDAAMASTGLALPWAANGGGWRHWGVHGDSGTSTPYNAIDFYGGDGNVRAAQSGRVYRFCGTSTPYIKVVHDNGWTTGYYHTVNQTTVPDGSQVALGAYIGQINTRLPCGGRANGDHVHWTLWKGGTAVGVNGKEIGGWTWYAQSTAYQGYAVRGGTTLYNSDCCLVNYGPGTGQATGIVRNDGGTVNIRTGPHKTDTVVRTANDGDTVTIVCTVTGDAMTGPWNNTSSIWDRLPDGYYISDAFVDTGSDDPVAPACT